MHRLRVDWPRCQGRGLCAELLPERITLDEWGYAFLDGTPVRAHLEELAREAAESCPVGALRLVRA